MPPNQNQQNQIPQTPQPQPQQTGQVPNVQQPMQQNMSPQASYGAPAPAPVKFSDPDRKKRLLYAFIIFGLAAFIILTILRLLLSSTPIAEEINVLAAQNQELGRVTEEVLKKRGLDSTTASLAATTRSVTASNLAELNELMNQQGGAPDIGTEYLLDSSSDEELTSAEQNNRISEAYYDLLEKHIGEIKNQSNVIFEATSDNSIKSTILTQYQSIEILEEAIK